MRFRGMRLGVTITSFTIVTNFTDFFTDFFTLPYHRRAVASLFHQPGAEYPLLCNYPYQQQTGGQAREV
jgi:hypothetical protein